MQNINYGVLLGQKHSRVHTPMDSFYCFCRWDSNAAPLVHNLILLSSKEADRHDEQGLKYLKDHKSGLYDKIESTLMSVKAAFGFSG